MIDEMSALVSMNAFKGSLSNVEACRVVAEALDRVGIKARQLPIGDGGAGTLATVQAALGGVAETFDVTGPLGRPALARVLCLPDPLQPTTLYIESADVCGLRDNERDALRASSHGLGELIVKCLEAWRPTLKKIYVGLGDSATSDMGMGMLSALGFQFRDLGGKSVWGNASGLRLIRTVIPPSPEPFRGVKFTVLCDVLNPVCGPNGAARIFSPQKGANPEQVFLIEQGMENFADIIQAMTGRKIRQEPMTGAAGGLGAAFLAFLKAELVHGARFLFDWIHFDSLLSQHAFVITGEGQTDVQTMAGKAPLECVERAERLGKRAVILSGAVGQGIELLLKRAAIAGCYACGNSPSAQDALASKVQEVFTDEAFLKGL